MDTFLELRFYTAPFQKIFLVMQSNPKHMKNARFGEAPLGHVDQAIFLHHNQTQLSKNIFWDIRQHVFRRKKHYLPDASSKVQSLPCTSDPLERHGRGLGGETEHSVVEATRGPRRTTAVPLTLTVPSKPPLGEAAPPTAPVTGYPQQTSLVHSTAVSPAHLPLQLTGPSSASSFQ